MDTKYREWIVGQRVSGTGLFREDSDCRGYYKETELSYKSNILGLDKRVIVIDPARY